MKLLLPVFLLVTAATQPVAEDETSTGVTVLSGVEMQLVLGPDEAKRLGGRLFGAYDVSRKGRVLVGIEGKHGRNLVVPQIGVRLLAKDDTALATFCRTQAGALVAIRKGHLARYEDGELVDEVELPSPRMQLVPASKSDAVLVFGHRRVYEIEGGRRYRKLLETPTPITALADMGGRLYVALGPKVIGVSSQGATSIAYEPPPGAAPVVSLAADVTTRTLFMATADGVQVLRGGRAAGLLAGCGGELLFRNGSLYVLDPRRGLLARLPRILERLDGRKTR